MSDNITKEGVTVEKDQVWRDLDKRMPGRHAKVESVSGGKAIMYPCTAAGHVLTNREIKVSIARMYKHSTGWELVRPTVPGVVVVQGAVGLRKSTAAL